MEYDLSAVKKLIMYGYKPNKPRSVEKNIMLRGHRFVFAVIVTLTVFHVIAFLGDHTVSKLPLVLLFNIIFMLLAPVVGLITVRMCENALLVYSPPAS